MSDMKPSAPSCEGKQFDENKEYISVHFDADNNVLPSSDPSNHENATPGMGSFNFSGKQYAHDTQPGTDMSGSYGSKTIGVDAQSTERGEE